MLELLLGAAVAAAAPPPPPAPSVELLEFIGEWSDEDAAQVIDPRQPTDRAARQDGDTGAAREPDHDR